MIALAGSVAAGFLAFEAAGNQRLQQENKMQRGGVLGEEQSVLLEGSYNGRKEVFQIQMEPLQLNLEEMEEWRAEFSSELPALIAGNNVSLQEVRQDLALLEKYEDFPFSVEWRSLNSDIVTSSGKVKPAEQDEEVTLTADIFYGEQTWREEVCVTVLAEELSPEEYQYREVNRLLVAAEQNSREEEYWTLPAQAGDTPVTWRKPVEDYSLAVGVGACVISLLLFFLGDKDLHQELEKQKICMKREYPDIVHKLALYLGAGMTLQGAFQKIGMEYEQQKKAGKGEIPAYEQILYTCRELKSGVSEISAYERFGKRISLQEYIRLSTLMTQNLKKGSATLLPRLYEEAERSQAERLQAGRKLGEEASTKLLVPMVMMLGVVMVMVVLPAFGSMGL